MCRYLKFYSCRPNINSAINTAEIKSGYWKIKKFLNMFINKPSIENLEHEILFIKFCFLEGLFVY